MEILRDILQRPELFLGPFGGLLLSLLFCFLFLRRFEKTLEHLFRVFETELEICHHRYDFMLTELMKLKDRKASHDRD